MFEILVSEDAENDLNNIWRWYEGQKLGLGKAFISSFEKTLEMLGAFPQSKTKIKFNLHRCLLHKFPFVVYYLVDRKEKTVKIIGILHFKRGNRAKKVILAKRK
jgi:plasmid stabilization system protein ParE